MSAGSLFSAETRLQTRLQTGIGLSDEILSILAIAFLSEDRKFQAFWRSAQFERHLYGFSDKTSSLSQRSILINLLNGKLCIKEASLSSLP